MSKAHKITMNACLTFITMAPAIFGVETKATKMLKARNVEFRKEVIKVTDNVYTAVGYSVQPVSMIVGTDGLIIVDIVVIT